MKILNSLIVGFLVDANPLSQKIPLLFESCDVAELKLPKNAERWDCVGDESDGVFGNIVVPWTFCYLKCAPGYIATSCEFKRDSEIDGQLASQTIFKIFLY